MIKKNNMARPKTKSELMALSSANFKKLNALIESYDAEEQGKEFPKGTMNRNIRDVLAHLQHWHLMFFDWYSAGMQGKKPVMPAKGFTWKTVPELNQKIWEHCQNVDLKPIKDALNASFSKLQDLIASHSDEELFTKKKYNWTGTTSMGSYLISTTASHYDWAFKLIKRAKK